MILANNLGLLCQSYRSSADPTVLFAWLSALGFFFANLLRLFRLQRHGHWPGADSGLSLPGKFPVSLLLPIRYGVLAAVAHDLGQLVPGLCIHSLRRKPDREAALDGGTSCWSGALPVCGTGGRVELSPYGDCSTPYCCWEKKLWYGPFLAKMPWFSHIYLLLSVLLGFVLFQGGSLGRAGGDFRAMLGAGSIRLSPGKACMPCGNHGVLLILGALGATPLPGRLYRRWSRVCNG